MVAWTLAVVTEDPATWTHYLDRGGVIFLLVLVFWLVYTGRLVPGRQADERLARSERLSDEWKAMALGMLARIEAAVEALRDKR